MRTPKPRPKKILNDINLPIDQYIFVLGLTDVLCFKAQSFGFYINLLIGSQRMGIGSAFEMISICRFAFNPGF